MKITRIELCHPVNRPGKHDDNFRELPPSHARGDATCTLTEAVAGDPSRETYGVDFGYGVIALFADGRTFIPIGNIKSIDYEETSKK